VLFLAGVLALTATACATTPEAPVSPEERLARLRDACEHGHPAWCDAWGEALVESGDRLQAEAAYGRSCEGGNAWGCIVQGRLLMERGELTAAEAPLRKALEGEFEEAYEALAELHEARAAPGDRAAAERLRWEGLAVDEPLLEVLVGYRADASGVPGVELALNLQPMLLLSRRLSLGLHVATLGDGSELNGFIAYQHYASTWVVPYARLLLGSWTEQGKPGRLNFGGELGLKLTAGPLGHLNVSLGSSRASPFHISLGVGFNAIFLLAL
jgi:hypothetical protein